MSQSIDAIILGLGGMGSAVACHLAARGRRVIGLEQFTPPHDKGSSHGKNRVIRQAYYEDPAYVPLLLRAYELWRQLEHDSGTQLLTITGGLMLGTADSAVVTGSLRSARQHGLPHEQLDAPEIRRRFPQFNPDPDTVALYEANAGFVCPEEAVSAHLAQARRHGATLQFEEAVTGWKAAANSVRITTRRETYEAEQLVICAGPWLSKITEDLALPLKVERQVQFWFEPGGGIEPFLPDRFPIWIWETKDGGHPYGLPALDGASGVKVAIHHGGKNHTCTPETIDRSVSNEEVALARSSVSALLPALNGPCLRTATCMYTDTPDEHFLIDRHPGYPQVLIVSPCSGHGFKFCPVIGEIVADLVTKGKTVHPINLFRRARLSHPGNAGSPGVEQNK